MDHPSPLTEFTLFPLLPTELRLKIYKHILALTTPPILKLFFSPSQNRYTPNHPPSPALSLCSESRYLTLQSHAYLRFGPSLNQLPIPINRALTTLYITLPPSPPLLLCLIYHLSVSPSRHQIRSLAIDLRIWNELCENGFLSVLAGMRKLREVCMVVEFGRVFEGELGFLEAPEWRCDLRWLAGRAAEGIGEERVRGEVCEEEK